MATIGTIGNIRGRQGVEIGANIFQSKRPKVVTEGFVRRTVRRLIGRRGGDLTTAEERQHVATRLDRIWARLEVLELEAEVRGRRRKGGNGVRSC